MFSTSKFSLVLLLVCISLFINAQLFQNAQAAGFAIGSVSPNSAGSLGTNNQKLSNPVAQSCYAIDAKHNCVWVADYFGNRVLRFSYPITSNFPTANLVLGQTNFTSSNFGGATAGSMGNPQGLAVDTATGNLFVLCISQNRILRFNSAHTITTNGSMANAVFGQIHYGTTSAGVSQNQFNFDQAPACGNLLHYDQLTGALWVSDNGNARVLRFNNANTLSINAGASAVLGQSTFASTTQAVSSTHFTRPDGLTTIGTALFVSDPVNNRILRFDNVYAKTNGAAADAVFGQTSFTSSVSGTAANLLASPTDLTGNQTQLIVADVGNSRVLVFENPLNSTVAAEVLLAPSLTVPGNGVASSTAAALNYNIEYDGKRGQLFVQDRQNSRILVFQSCPHIQISGTSTVCSGGSITLSAAGASSLSWSTNQTSASIVVYPLGTTTYSVLSSFTAPNFTCSSMAVKTVSVFQRPTISITSGTICQGQSFTLTPSGAATYLFEGGNAVVSPTITTTYTTRGYSAEGCLSLNTVKCMITVNQIPVVTFSVVPKQTCLNAAPVQVLVNPSGGSVLGYAINNGTFYPGYVGTITLSYNYTDPLTGCSASDTASLKVDACTGIKQLSQETAYSVYPNPTKQNITVQYGEASVNEILVGDAMGRRLFSKKIITKETETTLDLSTYPAGIYFVSIMSVSETKTLKVIKE